MSEFPAGDGQTFVTYYSRDDGSEVDTEQFMTLVSRDVASRAADGWKVQSCSVFPSRQVGTAGNIMFQSGGQRATMVTAVVLYVRA